MLMKDKTTKRYCSKKKYVRNKIEPKQSETMKMGN